MWDVAFGLRVKSLTDLMPSAAKRCLSFLFLFFRCFLVSFSACFSSTGAKSVRSPALASSLHLMPLLARLLGVP